MKFELKESIAQCTDGNLKKILGKLEAYNAYLFLLKSDQTEFDKFLALPGAKPQQVKEWFRLFNGGYLFDTFFFSSMSIYPSEYLKFIRFQWINSGEIRMRLELPKNLTAFAISSFGDLYCYNNEGLDEISQWSTSRRKMICKWNSFAFWLNDEINIAIELATDKILLPSGYQKD